LRHWRERAERIKSEAGAIIDSFRHDVYSEARRREQTAQLDFMADEWSRIALAVERKMGLANRGDSATPAAMDIDLTATSTTRAGAPSSDRHKLAELRRILYGR
jgi:hypothetical protein